MQNPNHDSSDIPGDISVKVLRFIVKQNSAADYLMYLDNFLVYAIDGEEEGDHSLGAVNREVTNKGTEDPIT